MTTAIQPIIYASPIASPDIVSSEGGRLFDAAIAALTIATHELRAVTDRVFEAVLPAKFEHESDEAPFDSTTGGRLDRYLYREMTGTPHTNDSPIHLGFVRDAGGGGLAMRNRAIVALKPSQIAALLDPTTSTRMQRLATYTTYHELLHILPLDVWSPMLWGLPHRQPLAAMALETATAYLPGFSARAYRRFADNAYADGRSLHPAEIHRIRSTALLATVRAPVVAPVIMPTEEPPPPEEPGEPEEPERRAEMPRELTSTAARVALLPHLFVPGKVTITGVRVDRRRGYVTEVYELRRSLGRE